MRRKKVGGAEGQLGIDMGASFSGDAPVNDAGGVSEAMYTAVSTAVGGVMATESSDTATHYVEATPYGGEAAVTSYVDSATTSSYSSAGLEQAYGASGSHCDAPVVDTAAVISAVVSNEGGGVLGGGDCGVLGGVSGVLGTGSGMISTANGVLGGAGSVPMPGEVEVAAPPPPLPELPPVPQVPPIPPMPDTAPLLLRIPDMPTSQPASGISAAVMDAPAPYLPAPEAAAHDVPLPDVPQIPLPDMPAPDISLAHLNC